MPEAVTFDHYEVLTRDDGSLYELGRGAMGITYKAFDTNLRVPVALKVINCLTLNGDVARQRFIREARSAARLRHRHVASVFHLGTEGDTYYYAMEYIDGETVEALVKRQGPLTPVMALRIAVQVARALNAAQQHGLVHRDIKPSNMMLVREDDELVLKVIDFGLAKNCLPGEADEDAATLSLGGFVGTPHFASPEQLEDKEIDVRTDIYSLGVTLWYMLSGHTPFGGSMAQVMSQHLTKRPPFEKLGALPPPVANLLRKMLAKDPADRHQTPAELRQEIEQCLEQLAGGPVAAAERIAVEEENFATLLDDASLQEEEAQWEPGATIVERYELLEALGETNSGHLFRALDRERKEEVRLLVLHRELTEDAALYTQLEREVLRIAPVQHANLLRIHGLETAGRSSFVVLEWTKGVTMLELLRARRELGVTEVLPILAQAAAGIDFAVSAGLKRLDLVLHQIFLHLPDASTPAEELLRKPLSEWPHFLVKLNPLGITRELSMSETWAGGQTLVGGAGVPGRAVGGDLRSTYLSALGAIAYELLGGTLSPLAPLAQGSSHGTRYSPLAPLTEEGNEVLKRVMSPNPPYASAAAFQKALEAAEEGESRPAAKYETRAPAPPPPVPQIPVPSTAPAAGRGPIPVGFIGGLVTVLAVGTAMFFILRQPDDSRQLTQQKAPSPAPATPAPTPSTPPTVVTAEPTGESAISPVPETTTGSPSREDLLAAAVTSARTLEEGGNWKRAIQAWMRVLKEFPQTESGRIGLEVLLKRLRERPQPLTDAEFADLRDLLTEAAHLDILEAMLVLGEALRERSPVDAFNWVSAAAARGHAGAMTQLGLMLSNGVGTNRDLVKAVACFQEAAELDNPGAKALLAECYLYGKGVPKNEAKAMELLIEASNQGNVHAMNRLGTCYHQGVGTKRDFAEALRLFLRAAEQGHGEAIGNLGVLYFNGEGVPPNAQKAVELFQKGIRLGDAYCMYLYARCLEAGKGVASNPLQAQGWYKKAAEAGHPGAIQWCREHGVPVKAK